MSLRFGARVQPNYNGIRIHESGGTDYMNKIVVVCDLGHFRTYRLSKTVKGTAKLDMIESFDSIEAHGRFADKLSDKAGNFGRAVGPAGGSGEAHNITAETEKRVVKRIAGFINKIVKDEKPESWYLAAETAINGQLQDCIDAEVKAKLEKHIQANLTKADKNEIIKRFV
jgi:hypothetical protein